MNEMSQDIEKTIQRILTDIRVELGDEYDKNFERQGYFGRPWQRRKSPTRGGGAILIDTGRLRQSLEKRVDGDGSVTFESRLPYAAIHNEGGEMRVTRKMKAYFWARYRETRGALGRKKSGELRKDKRNERLSNEAAFWKAMALKKVGDTIKMPERRFVGYGPEAEKIVRDIVEKHVEESVKIEFEQLKNNTQQ